MILPGLKFIALIVLIVLPAVLIRSINVPREERYRQFWAPIVALIFSLISALLIKLIYVLIESSTMTGLINHVPQELSVWLLDNKWIIFNALCLYIFLLIKGLGIGSNRTFRWLKNLSSVQAFVSKLLSSIGLNPDRILGDKIETGSRTVALAYLFSPGYGIYLKPRWIFTALFFDLVSIIPYLLVLAVIIFAVIFPNPSPPNYLPELFTLPLIMLVEIALFLQGPRLSDLEGSMDGSTALALRQGRYDSLFKQYTSTWSDRIIASGINQEPSSTGDGQDPRFCKGNSNLRIWCEKNRRARGAKRHAGLDCAVYCEIVNDLLQGKNVMVTDAVHTDISPFIFSALLDFMTDGSRILVVMKDRASISDAVEWINAGLSAISGFEGIWGVMDDDTFLGNQQEPYIMVTDLSMVSRRQWFDRQARWMEKVELIFFPVGFGQEPEQDASARCLASALHDLIARPLQFLIFTKSYEGREPWIRNLIKAPLVEYYGGLPRTDKLYYIIWRSDGPEDIQRSVLPRLVNLYIGDEIPLALPAIRAGVEVVRLIKQQTQPWHEYLAELSRHHKMLQDFGLPAGKAMEIGHYFEIRERNWQVPVETTSFMMIRDDEFNLVKTLVAYWARGRNSCFINMISPPYLLRDYLAANVEYYCRTDLLISAWTPLAVESPKMIGYVLLKRLQNEGMREEEIVALINQAGLKYQTVRQGLINLLELALGAEHDFTSSLQVQVRELFDVNGVTFGKRIEYHLPAAELNDFRPEWSLLFELIDENTSSVVGVVTSDRAERVYLPGQVHAFGGELYEVKSVDRQNHRVNLYFVDPKIGSRPALYRNKRIINVRKIGGKDDAVYNRCQERGPWLISESIRSADYDVQIAGYNSFTRNIDLTQEKLLLKCLDNRAAGMTRSYPQGRLLDISIKRKDDGSFNQGGRLGFSLAVLMQEIMCTLFPNSYQLLVVGTLLPQDFFTEDSFSQNLRDLFAGIEGVDLSFGENEIRLLLWEDSELELGILQAFVERWNDLLRLIEDYLTWLLEECVTDDNQAGNLSSDYLYFGSGRLPETFDFTTLLGVLRELPLGDLIGPARHRYYSGEEAHEFPESEKAICDFCGQSFPAAQWDSLQDERVRCPDCGRTAINNLKELKPLYNIAREFLLENFKKEPRKEIKLRFCDAKELGKLSGLPFTATEAHDARAVGLAVQRGRKLSMYIENGAPAGSTICTLVHELVHIWQYDNLRVRELSKQQVEGLAVWSEIIYMERSGDQKGAERYRAALEQRQDVYWEGLQIVDAIAAQMSQDKTPFDYFLEKYKLPEIK